MRIDLRVVLTLVLVGLSIWFWRLRAREPEALDLGSFSAPGEIMHAERIVYSSLDGDTIVVVRGTDRYLITQPIEDEADPTRILQTLQAATRLKPTRGIPTTDLAPYGLVPPRHRFTAELADGMRWSIALGDTVPVGGQVYAVVEPLGPKSGTAGSSGDGAAAGSGGSGAAAGSGEETTLLLLREFGVRRDFYPPLGELRDPLPLALPSPIVDSVDVVTRDSRLRAVRESRSYWRSVDPPGLELDPLLINRALQQLRTPSIRKFLPPDADPRDYGMSPPRARWIVYQDAFVETVTIGSPNEEGTGVYVRPAGRAGMGEITSNTFRELVDGWPGLASRRILRLDPKTIERVEFVGTEAAYARTDSGWVRLPEATRLRREAALVQDLENLSALQWISYPMDRETPAARADVVTLRLVPESAAGMLPDSSGVARPEIVTMAAHPDSGVALARTDRRDLWGRIPESNYRVWRYRRDHSDL
ncbi:MAG: DUF4340 domain-containing protein [Candidatus Eisenbacteria bacterium]